MPITKFIFQAKHKNFNHSSTICRDRLFRNSRSAELPRRGSEKHKRSEIATKFIWHVKVYKGLPHNSDGVSQSVTLTGTNSAHKIDKVPTQTKIRTIKFGKNKIKSLKAKTIPN